MAGKLLDVSFVIAGPKVVAYLLNPQHKRGGSKARYLHGFGFSLAEPNVLADALVAHVLDNLPGKLQPQPEGPDRLRFEGVIRAPDGRDMPLCTIWEVIASGDERTLRFITAFPGRARDAATPVRSWPQGEDCSSPNGEEP